LSAVKIRTATKQDIDSILELWQRAGSVPTVSDNPDSLARLLDRDPEGLLVAEVGARLVGSVIVGWDGWRGTIYRLAVAPEHRRAGIASALVGEAQARLLRLGARRLNVVVVDDDPAAMGFWAATGLTRQAHRARFVREL
jgi:ribosomal protein S18 acetylase RimI-like enzyme